MADKVTIIPSLEGFEDLSMSKKEQKKFQKKMSKILRWFIIGLLCGCFLFIVLTIKQIIGMLK